jgi:hypothetical protein
MATMAAESPRAVQMLRNLKKKSQPIRVGILGIDGGRLTMC